MSCAGASLARRRRPRNDQHHGRRPVRAPSDSGRRSVACTSRVEAAFRVGGTDDSGERGSARDSAAAVGGGQCGGVDSADRRRARTRGITLQRAPQRSTQSSWTKLDQGDIGELLVEQLLDRRGFEVFRDWSKNVNSGGIDTIAYDPAEKILYVIDNKAQRKTINNATALSIRQLGNVNIDGLRHVLDAHTGFPRMLGQPSGPAASASASPTDTPTTSTPRSARRSFSAAGMRSTSPLGASTRACESSSKRVLPSSPDAAVPGRERRGASAVSPPSAA